MRQMTEKEYGAKYFRLSVRFQNILRDIRTVIEEATSPHPANSAGDYIREIAAIMEEE